MRYVSVLIQGHRQMSEKDVKIHLDRVLKQAEIIYGGFGEPEYQTERLEPLSQYIGHDVSAEDLVTHLRGLLEPSLDGGATDSGEVSDEKIQKSTTHV